MKRNLHLLVIDPQNDFCDLPAEFLPAGAAPALPVPGAHADMLKVAGLVRDAMDGLAGISVTLDSHQRLDIAHPTFWTDAAGREVAPFTQVTLADVRAGRYLPRDAAALTRTLDYLDALETAGRYTLMVWPVHCEMGTWGHKVHAVLQDALDAWEQGGRGKVNEVAKGANPWTEHYSAIQAEVPDKDDVGTQLNAGFVALLAAADKVYIAGEAGSHCVKATTEHLVANVDPGQLSKLVLLTDCISPVSGFDAQYHGFLADMAARGLQIATVADVLPELRANAQQ